MDLVARRLNKCYFARPIYRMIMSGGYEFVGGGFQLPDPSSPAKAGDLRSDPMWVNATFHRDQVSKLLAGSTQLRDASLCIWGAGPCTDLGLELFINRFTSVTLVDIDAEAMTNGLRLRGLQKSEKIETIGELDISGISELVKQYGESREQGLLEKIKTTASEYQIDGLKKYDVVASVCLISQLQNHLTENVGAEDPAFPELLGLVRRRHLELLLEHTNPGGSAILVTDLTSSDALPALANCGEYVTESIWKEIVAGNHFHGMNPNAIGAEFDTNPKIKSQLSKSMTSRPWVWNATDRSYACVAYCAIKK